MKISKTARPAKAGDQFAEAIIEIVHLLYLRDNALQFLSALISRLQTEFKRRKEEGE